MTLQVWLLTPGYLTELTEPLVSKYNTVGTFYRIVYEAVLLTTNTWSISKCFNQNSSVLSQFPCILFLQCHLKLVTFFWFQVLMFVYLSIQRPPFVSVANDNKHQNGIWSLSTLELHNCTNYKTEARQRSHSPFHCKFSLQIGLAFLWGPSLVPFFHPHPPSILSPSPFIPTPPFIPSTSTGPSCPSALSSSSQERERKTDFCIPLSFNHLIMFLLLLQWNICQSLNLCEYWLIMKMILNYSHV